MIRNNLATRPFYNDRAVQLWIGALAVIVAVATLVNVQRLLSYSRSDTELATRASNDEQRAASLRAEATRLRASVNASEVEAASEDARQANDLIDRRTFSWTALFNRFESTLPADVRITSLRHKLDRSRGIVITIAVLSRTVEDVEQFIERLTATSAFADVLAVEERMNTDTQQLEVTLEAVYRPIESTTTAAASAPAPTGAAPARGGNVP